MSKSQTEARQLKWLADSIINEMEKPDDKIDWEFIEICEELTKIFLGEKQLSEEEINARISIITKKQQKFKTVKLKRRIKSTFVAAVAAVIFIFSSITVYAMTPLKDYIIKTLQLDEDQSVPENDTDHSYCDSTGEYLSLEDFVNADQREICYPEYLPYNARIIKIINSEEGDHTVFLFSDPQIAFSIYYNNNTDLNKDGDTEIIEYNNKSFYIHKLDNMFTAYFTFNNDLYTIKCNSESELLKIIYSINFDKVK